MAEIRSDSTPASCAAIVLAAGASTRLGQPKQMVRIDGETLVRRTVRLALESGCSPIVVVLGCAGEDFAQELGKLATIVVSNPEWRSGMASSLKSGLKAVLDENAEQAAIMLLVCDQPRLDSSVLRRLLDTHHSRRPPITASHYENTLGVPAIFSKELFPALFSLDGDQGARRILQQNSQGVIAVDFAEGSIDIDTPEDLETFETSESQDRQ